MLHCKISRVYIYNECSLKHIKKNKVECFSLYDLYCIDFLLKNKYSFFILSPMKKDSIHPVYINNVIFKYNFFDFLHTFYINKSYIIFYNGYFLKTNISKDYLTVTYRNKYLVDFFKVDFFLTHNIFKNSCSGFYTEDIFLSFNDVVNEVIYILDVSNDIYNTYITTNNIYINFLPNTNIEFFYICTTKENENISKNVSIFILLGINSSCRYFVTNELSVNSLLCLDIKVVQSSFTFFYCFFLNLGILYTKFILKILSDGIRTKNVSHIIFVGSFNQILDIVYGVKILNSSSDSFLGLRVVLKDFSVCLFTGLITIYPSLLEIEADMITEALLLSKDSTINFKPQLNIQSKFVKCQHSVSTYFLRAEEIFYLCSRGITKEKANSILLLCYLVEFLQSKVLSNVSSKYIRNKIMKSV